MGSNTKIRPFTPEQSIEFVLDDEPVLLCLKRDAHRGWLFRRGAASGQWEGVRKATDEDLLEMLDRVHQVFAASRLMIYPPLRGVQQITQT